MSYICKLPISHSLPQVDWALENKILGKRYKSIYAESNKVRKLKIIYIFNA